MLKGNKNTYTSWNSFALRQQHEKTHKNGKYAEYHMQFFRGIFTSELIGVEYRILCRDFNFDYYKERWIIIAWYISEPSIWYKCQIVVFSFHKLLFTYLRTYVCNSFIRSLCVRDIHAWILLHSIFVHGAQSIWRAIPQGKEQIYFYQRPDKYFLR